MTTHVTRDLRASSTVPATEVKVEPVHGEVSLSGTVATKAAHVHAMAPPKMSKGVKRVD
ncbi:BON domain-containing protein, partial [Stenotrophomonas sp. SrG]|uniref:BON domain-containing protein n=1 Tax=Stenotrophomonas sp. SrG TaxID=3414430 RepID=UPI003CEAC36C